MTLKSDKPRICKVLGIEQGEVFSVRADSGEYRRFAVQGIRLHHVREDGSVGNRANNMSLWLIEHPDRIIRKPRFSEEEKIALCYICKCFSSQTGDELVRNDNNVLAIMRGEEVVICLPRKLFSSLSPGQSVMLAEIVGGDG